MTTKGWIVESVILAILVSERASDFEPSIVVLNIIQSTPIELNACYEYKCSAIYHDLGQLYARSQLIHSEHEGHDTEHDSRLNFMGAHS